MLEVEGAFLLSKNERKEVKMSTKEKNIAIIKKYININARSAYLKIEGFEGIFPSWVSKGKNAFSVLEVMCIHSPECQHTVYGYYPSRETPAPDYSNFVFPPLCGEHLLEAVKALDELFVQALFSLDQNVKIQEAVRKDQHAKSAPFRRWETQGHDHYQPLPSKAKNRME